MNHYSTTSFISDLEHAARQNPVSALLIGSGLAWLFLGGARLTAAAALVKPAARAMADNAGDAMAASTNAASSVVEGVRSMTTAVAEAAESAIGSVSDQAKGAVDSIRTTSSTANNFATETVISPIVENLKHAFERQPLLIGGVGLAIGCAIATALPQTKMEDQAFGEASERVSSSASTMTEAAISDVKNRADQAIGAMSEEAAAQGLTSKGAKSTAADIGRKLKDVASAAPKS